MAGIDKTLEVFDDLGNIAVAGVALVKGGLGFNSLGPVLVMLQNAKELMADIPASLPEVMDLDQVEAARLGQATFALIKKIMVAVKG